MELGIVEPVFVLGDILVFVVAGLAVIVGFERVDVVEVQPLGDDAGLDVGDGCGAGAFDADGVAVYMRVEAEDGDFVLAGLVMRSELVLNK